MTPPRLTAHGYWLEEAGGVEAAPALRENRNVDVVVIGGGYTGLWTAWQLSDAGARVAVLEARVAGHGPSGRNGGFCEGLWFSLPALRRRRGDEQALAACDAAAESVRAIGEWCRQEGVDAWFSAAGYICTATAAEQEPALRAVSAAARTLGRNEEARLLTAAEVRARCASDRFGVGLLLPHVATVQPARLALGLRASVRQRGVELYERSPVRTLHARGDAVEAQTADGARVRAGVAVLAVGAAARAIRPLRHRVAIASSHIVITEPVPDVLESLGWTDGVAITDARVLLHYMRTTPDGRIAFGWGGGRIACGARLHGRIERDGDVVARVVRDLVATFPALRGRAIVHAWGGPIDVAPSHLPQVGTLPGGRVHYALGFTGNGVGPSHLAGRALSALARGRRDDPAAVALRADPSEARVPPEPWAWLAGAALRSAWIRREAAVQAGRGAHPVLRAACASPRVLGVHVGR